MRDKNTTVAQLKEMFYQFVQDRDWIQFHTPKNIAMNLGVEVAELQEILVWHEGEALSRRVEQKKELIEDEVADIAFNLLHFCNICNIDLAQSIAKKLPKTAEKYPIESCKGKNDVFVEEGIEKKF